MKNLIIAIAIVFGITATVNAQTTSKKLKSEKQKVEMKANESVKMADNKVMLCKNDKCTLLTKTYTCTDGCKISTDGTVTKPNGMSAKLMNGYEIDKNGNMSMISHGQAGHVCGPECAMSKKM